jgi:hypothetical protein
LRNLWEKQRGDLALAAYECRCQASREWPAQLDADDRIAMPDPGRPRFQSG